MSRRRWRRRSSPGPGGPRRCSGRPRPCPPRRDAAACEAAVCVLDRRHGEGVLLGDLIQAPPIHAPADFPPFLLGGHEVERPWAVGRLDDVVAEPFVQLAPQVGLEGRVHRSVPALDGRHVLSDDTVMQQVGVPVGAVVGEEVPEFGEDGHGRAALRFRRKARLPVDIEDGAEVAPPFVRVQAVRVPALQIDRALGAGLHPSPSFFFVLGSLVSKDGLSVSESLCLHPLSIQNVL